MMLNIGYLCKSVKVVVYNLLDNENIYNMPEQEGRTPSSQVS